MSSIHLSSLYFFPKLKNLNMQMQSTVHILHFVKFCMNGDFCHTGPLPLCAHQSGTAKQLFCKPLSPYIGFSYDKYLYFLSPVLNILHNMLQYSS